MKKINILYVITKLELGGAQKQLLSLILGLDQGKFNIFLFCADSGMELSEAQKIKGLVLKESKFLERPVNPLKDILALIEIYRYIKNYRIDVVHTHSSKAGILGRFAARFAGAKIILHTVHGWSFHDYQPRAVRCFFKLLEQVAARFSDKIIVVSEYDRQEGLKNNIGVPEKYCFIRYGIDHAEFENKAADIKEEFGLKEEDLLVSNISCFKPQKAPLDFVRLAHRIKDIEPRAKFLLVGDGTLRGKIEKLSDQLGMRDKLILAGWRRDIPKILSGTDVFVLTSLWEGLPVTVLEAMACAKPVVATQTGGIVEAVKEAENGFLVAPQDINQMSGKVLALLKDASLRKSMGAKSRSVLGSSYRIQDTLNNTQNLYDRLIKEKGL